MTDLPDRRFRRPALLAAALVWLAIVALGVAAGGWVQTTVRDVALDMDGRVMIPALALVLLVYIVLSAVPFVPGAEIGFALLVLFGAPAAPAVWLGMCAALTLAYLAGRRVAPERIEAGLARIGLPGIGRDAARLARIAAAERADAVPAAAPSGWGAALLRRRRLTLALLLNLPGNTALGGGGGLAFAAGASGLFPPAGFLATVGLATMPVPLAFALAALLGV